MNKKTKRRLLIVITLITTMFLFSGCTASQGINITTETTFQQINESEGFFSSLFVYPMAQIINYLANTPLGVGGSVAIVTLVFNLVLLALTFKSSQQQQVMTTMQPELQKIQKKYEGRTDQNSRMKMAQEQQSLMSKYGITNPLAPLLGSFVQMFAVFIIFPAVKRADAVATGVFMGMNLELTPLEGITSGNMGYLVLFLLMIGAQFISMMLPQYLNTLDAKKEAEANHKRYVKVKNPQQGMMYFMIAFVGFISINWAAAMSLYWMCSSLVMVLKTFIMRNVTKKKGV